MKQRWLARFYDSEYTSRRSERPVPAQANLLSARQRVLCSNRWKEPGTALDLVRNFSLSLFSSRQIVRTDLFCLDETFSAYFGFSCAIVTHLCDSHINAC